MTNDSSRANVTQKSLGFIALSAIVHAGALFNVLLSPNFKTNSGPPGGTQAAEELSYTMAEIADAPAPISAASSSSALTQDITKNKDDEATQEGQTTGLTGSSGSASAEASGGYGLPSDTEIRDVRELSALPGNPKPTYPLQDKLSGKQGTTVLVGLVQADGTVTNVVVEQSSGSNLMDQSAVQAFSKWKFQPGQSGYIRSAFQFRLVGSAKEIPTRLRTQ